MFYKILFYVLQNPLQNLILCFTKSYCFLCSQIVDLSYLKDAVCMRPYTHFCCMKIACILMAVNS